MAVTVIPRSPQWYDYIAPVAARLLGGFIDNQFEKGREKRAYQRQDEAAAAEERRKRANIEAFHNYYGDGAFDVRSNPSQFMENVMGSNLWGIDPSVIKTAADAGAAPMTFQTVEQGNRKTAGGYDPVTGGFGGTIYDVALSPDTGADAGARRYAADRSYDAAIAEANARVKAAGINAGRGRPNPSQVIYGPNGEILFADPYDKTVTDSGVPGQPPAARATFDNAYASGVQAALDGLQKKYELARPEDWTDNDLAYLEQLQAAQSNLLFPQAGGGFVMPEYEPDPIYRPGSGGTAQPDAPAALPPGITEREVQAMIKESGESRDKVIAYLKKQKGTR
jgi:hypothetical protein